MNSWTTVPLFTFDMDTKDVIAKSFVCRSSRTQWPIAPFVKTGLRYFQKVAHPMYAMVRSLLLDERVSHLDSFAKNAAAFFKISRSSLSDAFSRLNRHNSASTDSLETNFWLLTSVDGYFFCQTCSSDGWMPSWREICVNECPPASARWTALRLNSSLNVRRSCFPMIPRGRIFAGTSGVSGKSGQAQNSSSPRRAPRGARLRMQTTVQHWYCVAGVIIDQAPTHHVRDDFAFVLSVERHPRHALRRHETVKRCPSLKQSSMKIPAPPAHATLPPSTQKSLRTRS